MNIFDFCDKYNIPYKDKTLIEQAFVHTSYANEHRELNISDNERLEFMGDAVLQIYSADKLYSINPPLKEGVMSTRRSNLVSEKALAKVAMDYELNQFLLLGAGEEKNDGRHKESIVSDMFEAFIGALYLDCGYDTVFKFLDIIMKPYIDKVDETVYDYKTKFQELIQADSRRVISYETVNASGPSNKPVFEVVAKVDNLVFGKGIGSTKKQAQENAAKDALEKLAR